MRSIRSLSAVVLIVLLLGCGKSRQLTSLLPDAPEGWKTEGGASTSDVSGVGHSSNRSYVPSGSGAGLGAQRVTVQILLAEKGATQAQLQQMAVLKKSDFKERKEVSGYPAYESFPLPDNDTHSLIILPKSGTYVEIVAYKGGPGWEKGENQQAAVSGFAKKMDLKKIGAIE